MNDNTYSLQKPRLRGHLHQSFFFFFLGATLILLIAFFEHQNYNSLMIYLASLNLLYLISTLYHRPNWDDKKRMLMRRLDHSAIFLLISGTACPIITIKLTSELSKNLQLANWVIALIGIFISLIWVKASKKINASIYLIAGFFWVIFLKHFYLSMNMLEFTLLLAGGFFYINGAIVYAFKKPNFIKNIFGYHEFFHLLVILGSLSHLLLIIRIFK